MAADAERPFAYLRYATAGEIWDHTKIALVVWLIIGGTSALFATGFDWGSRATGDIASSYFSSVPRWLWVWAIFIAVLWLLRGQTIPLNVPQLTFREWLAAAVATLLMMAGAEYLPIWLQAPLLWGVVIACGTAETLSEQGKKNYARLCDGAGERA